MMFAYHRQRTGIVVPPHPLVSSSVSPPLPQAQVNLIIPAPSPAFFMNRPMFMRMDDQRSNALLQFMLQEGLIPPAEEELKRKMVIKKLKEIVLKWIKQVASRRLPNHYFTASSAAIFTYGSYGLGVHTSESDIDALCVGPHFASLAEDFFIALLNILKNEPGVSEIHCVKEAKVPLMRFKFDGISVDFPYARLNVLSVHESVDIFNPFLLREVDDTSWKCLSGVLVNKRILQLVPDVERFRSLLRCVKLWAKRRCIYGNLFGLLGGVHLAILAAFICQRHCAASLSTLVLKFFETFTSWPWPKPVRLEDGMPPTFREPAEARSFMPIHLPCTPYEYCQSNITRSTFDKIQHEFREANLITKEIRRPDFQWKEMFQRYYTFTRYAFLLRIRLSASTRDTLTDWVGFVKSRFPSLLLKVEDVAGMCDPNPSEFRDGSIVEPNTVFFWGLPSGCINMMSVRDDFMRGLRIGNQGVLGRIEIGVVETAHFPKNGLSGVPRVYFCVQDCCPNRVPICVPSAVPWYHANPTYHMYTNPFG